MLRYAILGFLNYGVNTGYEIKTELDKSIAHFWSAKQSQIYATLKRLEGEGLLESYQVAQEKRPDRRIYELTEAGQAALKEWLEQPLTELDQVKSALIMKTFFAAGADREAILTTLRLQRSLHEERLKVLAETTAQKIREKAALHPYLAREAVMWEATRRFGQRLEEIWLEWIEETMAEVEEKL